MNQRNEFLIRLFRKYVDDEDENAKGGINKKAVEELTREIHSLINGHDSKKEDIDMTPLQFEQIYKLLDKNNNGYMDPIEMIDLIQAYETWLYEKEF